VSSLFELEVSEMQVTPLPQEVVETERRLSVPVVLASPSTKVLLGLQKLYGLEQGSW